MNMTFELTLGDLGQIIIGVGLIILIFYCISFVRNLIPGVKSLNRILQDTEVVTGIAAESSKEVQKVVGEVAESAKTVSDIIKGNQSVLGAMTSIVNALASLKNLLTKSEKKID